MSIKLTGKMRDISNMRFGSLVAIEPVGVNKHGAVMWKCKCDCGNEKVVSCNALTTGSVKSCGARYHRFGLNHFKTHGDSNERLYHIYAGIKSRCGNPNDTGYCWYGARGVKMCDEWVNDYESFKSWSLENGYDDSLSIDRIDPDKDYEPDNCRWSDNHTQANNKRNNHRITYNNQTKTLQEWANEYNIDHTVLSYRLKKGLTMDEAVNKPVRNRCYIITYNGKSQSISDWSRETGIAISTIRNRLNSGWSIDKVLTP